MRCPQPQTQKEKRAQCSRAVPVDPLQSGFFPLFPLLPLSPYFIYFFGLDSGGTSPFSR
jgi:hypothetical protein